MSPLIQKYQKEHEPLVEEFNQRLNEHGITEYVFPQKFQSSLYPPGQGFLVEMEHFVAVEDNISVRGGYKLKKQDFMVCEERRNIGYLQLPLSEGVIDKKYTSVGLQLVKHFMKNFPEAYALGMGGVDRPLPQLLKALGCSLQSLPFYFFIYHPSRFLNQITVVRTNRWRSLMMDIASRSLIIPGTLWALQQARNLPSKRLIDHSLQAVEVPIFSEAVDTLWGQCKSHFSLAAVRDQRTLNFLFPATHPQAIRLEFYSSKTLVGYAILFCTKMKGHKQFGDLCVGTLVDTVILPDYQLSVLSLAQKKLASLGADLMVTNQSFAPYCRALERLGFFKGPSNFALSLTRPLADKMLQCDPKGQAMHWTRFDGDGPIHL